MTTSQISTSNVAQRPQQPALDGIRAIAIIGVYVFHVWPEALPGGFTGVDVFFVLSGFLITSIIKQDIAAGTFSFREFYLRRIQRLLPNAALTVGATVLFALYFLPAGIANQASRHGLWNLLNLSNIFAYRNLGDYWGDKAENVPLTHFWSLGVEEQFYIIFPLTLFLLWKLCRRWTPFILAALAILSFILCYRITAIDRITGFYLPQYRFWELLAGAVLACFVNLFAQNAQTDPAQKPPPNFFFNVLGFLGVALILFSFIVSSNTSLLLGRVPLFAVLGSALLIYSALSPQTLLNKFLSLRPFAAIGKVSYSLYLWHWPAIIFGAFVGSVLFFDMQKGRVAGGVIGIVLAVGAYFLVEKPLRQRGKGRLKRLSFLAILTLISFSLCIAGKSYTFRFNSVFTYNLLTGDKEERLKHYQDSSVEFVHFHNDKKEIPSVAISGDSHAFMYADSLLKLFAQKEKSVAYFSAGAGEGGSLFVDAFDEVYLANTVNGARYPEHKRQIARGILAKLKENKELRIIIFCQRWDFYFPEKLETEFVKFMENVSSNTIVVCAAQPPVSVYNGRRFRYAIKFISRGNLGRMPVLFPDAMESRRREITARLEKLQTRYKNLRVIRPDKLFYNKDGSIRYHNGFLMYYSDSNHLTLDGAELTRPVFEKAIDEILKTQK